MHASVLYVLYLKVSFCFLKVTFTELSALGVWILFLIKSHNKKELMMIF